MKSLNKQTYNAVISRLNTIHNRNLELLQGIIREKFFFDVVHDIDNEVLDEIVSAVYTEFRKNFVFSKPKAKK